MLGDPIPDPGTVATNRTTLVASGAAEGWPRVAGYCPACGGDDDDQLAFDPTTGEVID